MESEPVVFSDYSTEAAPNLALSPTAQNAVAGAGFSRLRLDQNHPVNPPVNRRVGRAIRRGTGKVASEGDVGLEAPTFRNKPATAQASA